MTTMHGYLVEEALYESRQSRICRGRRVHDGLPVIFKILNEELPSAERQARFQQEYHLMRKMGADAILAAHAMESWQGKPVMILEDFGGTSLNRLDLAASLSLAEWLQLAIRITECLGQLHRHRVMHKDINPSNIVWNRQTGQLKLIDLGIATELSREVPEVRNPDRLEGTLFYLSPEQTGRMNRAMDYRTDFYSLGVTLYELLTGQLPFPSGDALALVHAHIAKRALPVHQVKLDIPEVVSAIIAKLMEKTAEERYQSAAGLKADLQKCLQTLDANGQIASFPLGEHDFSERLHIPQKLYGRETQINTLLQAFDRASQGPAELLLIGGYSGIGKSALVHEIQKPITERRGYFIEGKFDQFKKDIPYAAFTQAFEELIRQLLTEDEAVVATRKEKLLQVLGNNGQVIIDIVPAVEWIIGPQPPFVELPPEQAHHRFNHEFRKFVSVFASSEHPLAIFLDDLQWADLPSLQLMSLLLRAPALPHLLIIGAYRDNEVTPTHPLTLIVQEMQKNGATIQSVALPPLGLDEVSHLLCETLRSTRAKVTELGRLCLTKTQGNPFFLNQFLGVLVDQGMLYRDAAQGGWQWDMPRIEQADITDNIVDLLLAKLQKLSLPTQQILQGAACLGSVFDLKMLATVCALPEGDTADLLWEALNEELIVPLDDNYKYVGQAHGDAAHSLTPTYRFLHDRVQQAAYLLGSQADKSAMHLAIGRQWQASLSPAEQQARLFDLVNHLNLGRGLITDAAERRQLAQLNLMAARRAKTSFAYKPTLLYLQAALELVSREDWQDRYELMFALHLEAAEAAHLCVDPVQMERYINIALPHAKDLVDQAKVHEIRLQAYITQDKYLEVVSSGLAVLELLGVSFPRNPNQAHVVLSLAQTKLALAGKSIEDLAQLPDLTHPRILAARRILSKIASAAYYALPTHFPLLLLKSIRLSLKYGHAAPTSALDFAVYGMILGGVLGDIEQSVQYGELALRLQERPGMEAFKCRTLFVVHSMVQPWKKPVHETMELLMQDYSLGVELGDREFTGGAALVYCLYGFYCANELTQLEHEAATHFPHTWPAANLSMYMVRQTCLNLMGHSTQPALLLGSVYDEQRMREVDLMVFDKTLMFQLWSTRLILAYLFRDYSNALEHAYRAEQYIAAFVGFFGVAVFHFYSSLVRLALLDTATPTERAVMLRKIRKNQKKLQHWARHAPANFLNKWTLVEAELACQTGKPLKAAAAYKQAIHLARENRFLHEEALANELAGEFYLRQGQEFIAQAYLKEAQRCYRLWGAKAKAQDLAARFPQWLGSQRGAEQEARPTTIKPGDGTVSLTSTSNSGHLDFATAMKASQALSREIVLERLLKRLIQVVVENAGAQRGLLLLRKDKHWFVEAEQSDEDAEAKVLQSQQLEESGQADAALPMSLFHYVAHARESVVIHDALMEKLVANDPYVQQHRSRSLLAVPILHQGDLTGMVYLENSAVSGAFTEGRLEILHLLASQAAISIENARLYADMEERVAARTAELKAMSLRDGLTGVANRRAFDERLADELARSRRSGQPLSLMIVDIDHFKRVNDTYGHLTGDDCLRRMGATLAQVGRRSTDFVARYGGEEFAVLLPDTDLATAAQFAERVREAVLTIELTVGNVRHPITASIGVAQASGDMELDAAALIASADRRLYAAKSGGRNRVVSADADGLVLQTTDA